MVTSEAFEDWDGRAPVLLTTAELARLLRVTERTVYDLAARGQVPATRVTGKLLFPRQQVLDWIASQTQQPPGAAPAPPVYAGSNDPLLEWALGQSGAGLAILANGSLPGVQAVLESRALLAGCHVRDGADGGWNPPGLLGESPGTGWVAIHWARRTQGLLVPADNPLAVTGLVDAFDRGLSIALRAAGSGSRVLLESLLRSAGRDPGQLSTALRTASTHADVAAMVDAGEADCGLALQAVSGRLGFLPLVADESFDLVMRQQHYFQPPVQVLLRFAGSTVFQRRAAFLGGYDLSAHGAVRWTR